MFESVHNEEDSSNEVSGKEMNHWALLAEGQVPFENIIGQSKVMQDVFTLIQKVSERDCTVLINGRTGTGKGLVAKAIHNRSKRRNQPFIQINCGAIPENLLESELFGHVKGAFTGATSTKIGKFERANGGTIFLDEIGDMSPDLQVKVLKVLEEGEFEPVGGSRQVNVDVRIIAATHKDLEKEVKDEKFREDLYYRLEVIPIKIPSLSERVSDIPKLAEYFLHQFNMKNNADVDEISDDAMQLMMAYSWPGNVRELKNIVERFTVLNGYGKILPEHLPAKIYNGASCLKDRQQLSSGKIIYLNTEPNSINRSLLFKIMRKFITI